MIDEAESQGLSNPRPDPRFPNLFVVGAPKSGTTSMHAALAEATRTFMSKVKEPGFFSSDRQFTRGIEYYLDSYFSDAAGYTLRGESTPWYLYSKDARRRIFELSGQATPHIVILLRRPADRAYSMYLDQQRVGNEQRSFKRAVEDELRLIDSGNLPEDVRRRYVWCGRYATHLKDWNETFGGKHIRVFLTDDLRHPGATWSALSDFLGQHLGDDRLSQLSGRERNVAGALRWPQLDRALRALEGRDSRLIRRIQQALPSGWDRQVAQALFARNQVKKPNPVPPPPAAAMRLLDEYFHPEVIELQRILNRSLATWLPGNIARE
jgi:hypothetical protein